MAGRRILAFAAVLLLAQACVSTAPPPKMDPGIVTGLASWYGQEFSGRATANGEIFDPMLLTAAHRDLPFGTLVEVINSRNGRSVQVRINDRGPFVAGRVIDLSWAAAERIGMVEAGVVPVELRILGNAPAPSVAQSRATSIDSPPPAVPFPLPDSTTVESTEDPEVVVSDIDVVEVHRGEEVRRRVGPDGVTIEGGRTSSAAPSSTGSQTSRLSRFVVQVGSFLSRANAETLRSRVAALMSPAYVEQSGEMYRVRIGPFQTREAAIEAREKLETAGFSGVLMPSGD